jgi:hypothetical protein
MGVDVSRGELTADTDFVGTQGMAVLRSRDTPWRRALGVELTWGAYRPKAQTNPTRSGWRWRQSAPTGLLDKNSLLAGNLQGIFLGSGRFQRKRLC